MEDRCIITSASNKFFPSVLNLLGSFKLVYPNHPKIYVYDLGLLKIFRRELELINGVEVIKMPEFCKHWRSCYTWKTYIFSHPLANLNFYLDAGCQILRPLDELFFDINNRGLLLIDQGQCFKKIVPETYKSIFNLNNEFDNETIIHAGIIGFKNSPEIINIFDKIYKSAIAGLSLGFSPGEMWRNKYKNKNIFIRDCEIFRHDLTLLNIFFRKTYGKEIKIESLRYYDGIKNIDPKQFIWHLRLSYKSLENLDINLLHQNHKLLFIFNRFIVNLLILIKNIYLFFKKN